MTAEKIELDANKISFKGDTVVINENGITMADGSKIVGGEGIYTNLQFKGEGNLGYYFDSLSWSQSVIEIYADIPKNFTIKNANIVITHQPIDWDVNSIYDVGQYNGIGYARNVQIYQQYLIGAYHETYASEYESEQSVEGENLHILNETGKTFNSTGVETITSDDVSNYLTSGDRTIFVIASSEFENADPIGNDMLNIFKKTGRAFVTLNVIGYLNPEY